MIYKRFKGLELSALGMGAMRLPVLDGKEADIDVEQTQKMVDLAMECGVNYYDTAWGYHDGNSEAVLGACLKKYPREQYYLATKFPGYDLDNHGKAEEIFETQLRRCGVDYFDFYFVHNVCELNIDSYLDPKTPDVEYLIEEKKKGRIRFLGFSAHGDLDVMKRFLNKYGEHMEFCQIQLNYVDWKLQKAKEKVELLKEWNLPVWVMEPLRGGMLTTLSDARAAILARVRPDMSQADWAFRFIQSIPEVVVTLSGMSNYEQMAQNIETFRDNIPLYKEGLDALEKVADDIIDSKAVPCTSCHYCTSHCPIELDIPKLIFARNEYRITDGGFLPLFTVNAMPEGKKPADCIACGSCAAVCPQQIAIPEVLAELAEIMADYKF